MDSSKGWFEGKRGHLLSGVFGALIGAVVAVLCTLYATSRTHVQWRNQQVIEAYVKASADLEGIFVDAAALRHNWDMAVTLMKAGSSERIPTHTSEVRSLLMGIGRSKGGFDIHSVVIGRLGRSRDAQAKRWRERLTAAIVGLSESAVDAATGDAKELEGKQNEIQNVREEVFEAAKADIGAMREI